MVVGVTTGFTKTLEISGVGYRAQMQGDEAGAGARLLAPGRDRPAGRASRSASRRRPRLAVDGTDKELVGQVAANIRRVRKPEPYKGKGIRYAGERIRRKAGKAGKAARRPKSDH